MVLKVCIAYGLTDDKKPHFIESTFPPLPVISTTAQNLFSQIVNGFFSRKAIGFQCDLARLSPLNLMLNCRDKAGENDTVTACLRAFYKEHGIATGDTHCLNHQQNLGHIDVMFTVFDTKWLHGTNSIATFCNLASHRLRFVLKCKEVLPSVVDFEYGVRDVLDEEYEKELVEHFFGALLQSDRTHEQTQVQRGR